MNVIPLTLLQAAMLGGILILPMIMIALFCIFLYNFLHRIFSKKISDPDDLDRTVIWLKSIMIPGILGGALMYWYWNMLMQIRF